jgi:hypothetical protein
VRGSGGEFVESGGSRVCPKLDKTGRNERHS